MAVKKREYGIKLVDSGSDKYINRVLIATPSTGLVRIEWVVARYGQIIPVNWSQVQLIQYVNGYIPLRYQVADAQNLIVKECVEKKFEWLLLIEHDNIIPPDAFIRFADYMDKCDTPIVSGLYFTRSRPSYPLIFRGRGNGPYTDWKPGDKVFCDGVPTGVLLIHNSILKTMWDESPEYNIGYGVTPQTTRRVFDTPRDIWLDPETNDMNMISGTSDLRWCERIIKEHVFEKSGWPEYEKMDYPFLVDTNIMCKHINENGEQFP